MSNGGNAIYTKIEEDEGVCSYRVTYKDPSLNWPKQDTTHLGFNALNYGRIFEFCIWKETTTGDVLHAANLDMVNLPSVDAKIPKPTFVLKKSEMQDLVEQVWMCGFRPKQFGHYIEEAVRRYLEDGKYKTQAEKDSS